MLRLLLAFKIIFNKLGKHMGASSLQEGVGKCECENASVS